MARATFLAVQAGYQILLVARGQTVGMRAVRIRVVTAADRGRPGLRPRIGAVGGARAALTAHTADVGPDGGVKPGWAYGVAALLSLLDVSWMLVERESLRADVQAMRPPAWLPEARPGWVEAVDATFAWLWRISAAPDTSVWAWLASVEHQFVSKSVS